MYHSGWFTRSISTITLYMLIMKHTRVMMMSFNTCPEENILTILPDLSYQDCLQRCVLRTHCQSVNYKRLYRLCELNDGITELSQNSQKCYGLYAKRAKIEVVNVFDDIVTSVEKTCLEMVSGADTCNAQECKQLQSSPGRIVLGNRNEVGSKVIFECNTGYYLSGSRTSICADNGNWTHDTKCSRSFCDMPPENAPNGFISHVQIEDPYYGGSKLINSSDVVSYFEQTGIFPSGSIAAYECNSCFTTGNQKSSTCENGQWTFIPMCSPISTIRNECSSNADCLDSKSECASGRCWCEPGLSFSYSDCACVERCTSLADTFQFVPDKGIFLNNERVINDLTLTDCQDACLKATEFACRSFDYLPSRKCNLQSVVVADVENWEFKTFNYNIDYYQRDCA